MNIKQKPVYFVVLSSIAGVLLLASGEVMAVECSVLPDSICGSAETTSIEGSAIMKTFIWIINTLSVGVGVAAVAAIAFAGFLYTTSRDSPEQTKRAINMITNTVIGLVLYIFMWALVNFLVPGGLMYGGGSSTDDGSRSTRGGLIE